MEEQEESEMIALKKAYAEIILNTAKEAAARVMASEHKALRFQHDLCNTKDEAFRLSLRLKDMIEAKTTEAEVTSLSQERRIEELDAQLNETEGVILDLRAEIRKANHHLEEVKNSHKLYKNECTRRVLAIERNPSDEKILAENITEHDICTKKELVINKDEQNSVKCASLPIEGSEVLSKNSSSAKEHVKIRRLPRSSVRYSQTNPELSMFLRCQSLKSTTKPEKVSIKENCFEQDEKLMKNLKNDQSACTLCRSLRKRKAMCWDGMKSDECKYNSKSVAKSNQESKVGELSGLHRIDVFEDTEFINESLGKHEVDVKEASGVSRCNLIIDEDKVLTTGLILGESFGDAASDADKNRVLKYTFSRKRKKKPSLIEDVSSDSQNMVEVACQLISLSGKDMM